MDIRQLRYFVTVAQEGNFTRAAERLHIAQPPLSRQIQQIEERVGATLIDRSAKPLRLTPIGHLVYDQAISILARMADMDAMIAKAVVSQQRRFAIGFYDPAFRDVFFVPDSPLGIRDAVLSVLAGNWRPSLATRLRLRLFFAVVAVHRRVALTTRLRDLETPQPQPLSASAVEQE